MASKIVMTGGPSGGKTTVAQAIAREFGPKVHVVPEAASILFGGGWPRRKTEFGVQCQQRAIYFLQREAENLMRSEHPDKMLICDRGSLDGMAYWPSQGGEEFLKAVSSSLNNELARYDYVIHLDTAPESCYDLSNPLRTESFSEAWKINQRIKTVWSQHPQMLVIPGVESAFIEKLGQALYVVELILAKRPFDEVKAAISSDS